MLRRVRQFAVGIAGITVPLAVSAQDGGSVTVAPLVAGAPVLGLPALGVLAIALAVGAVFMLRRSRRPGARLVGVVAIMLTAAVVHGAVTNVIISGDECHQVTQESYEPFKNVELQSQCSNPIRIVDVQITCTIEGEAPVESVAAPPCEVGLIVPPGGSCQLPGCPC